MEHIRIKVDGKEHEVGIEELDDGKLRVHLDKESYEVESEPASHSAEADDVPATCGSTEDNNAIRAPLPGIVFAVLVKEGEAVKQGQPLVKIVAMKMENEIAAPKDATVTSIAVKKNDSVQKGDVLVTIS